MQWGGTALVLVFDGRKLCWFSVLGGYKLGPPFGYDFGCGGFGVIVCR